MNVALTIANQRLRQMLATEAAQNGNFTAKRGLEKQTRSQVVYSKMPERC